jgi:DNA-binding CsgD family transcriptional regulator
VAGGDPASARVHYDDALAVARDAAEKAMTARTTYHLAELASARGAFTQAMSLHHRALAQRHEIDDQAGIGDSLESLGGLAVARGDYERGARLFGAAAGLHSSGGFCRPARLADAYQAELNLVSEGLAPGELERAWAQGTSLTSAEAVAYALRGRGSRRRPERGPDALTPAERSVVTLVVDGLNNTEIADRLFISPRTVQSHLRKAFVKLEVTTRGQLQARFSGA